MWSDSPWFCLSSIEFLSVQVRGSSEWVFMEMTADDGTCGVSELTATQLHYNPAPLAAKLADQLRGQRVRNDDDVCAILGMSTEDCVRNKPIATAVSAIRSAVVDGLARQAGLKLNQYLHAAYGNSGKLTDRVGLYANINRSLLPNDFGPVERSPAAFADKAREANELGFSTIKCAPFDECRPTLSNKEEKLSAAVMVGLERFMGVKSCAGTGTVLVDCHSRFNLETGKNLGQILTDSDAGWFEEPVDPLAYPEDMQAIRQTTGIPVAGAEMGYGHKLFTTLIKNGTLDIVMPDVKFCGGTVEAYRAGVELELEQPGRVSLHCPSGPVSLITSAHITSAINAELPLEHAILEVDWRHETVEPYEVVKGGHLLINDEPGIGIRVNRQAVEARGKRWSL